MYCTACLACILTKKVLDSLCDMLATTEHLQHSAAPDDRDYDDDDKESAAQPASHVY